MTSFIYRTWAGRCVQPGDQWNPVWAANPNPFPYRERIEPWLFPRWSKLAAKRNDYSQRVHNAWGALKGDLECPW